MEGKEYTDWLNFGIRLRNARNSIGMTLETLAEKSNRTVNFISRVEAGKPCSIHTLYQFSKVLNISADVLLNGDTKAEIKEYKDREVIDNILDNCNEKQLSIIKDVLTAVCPNFDELMK